MKEKATKQKPAGRKSRLTPEIERVIIEAIEAGNYLSDAAAYAGVSANTLHEWIRRGEGRDPDRPATPMFATFATAIKKAEARSTVDALERIQDAAKGGIEMEIRSRILPDGSIETTIIERPIRGAWQADAWWLERRYPNEWGRRARLDHASPGSNRVEHNVDLGADLEALIRKIYGGDDANS